MEENDSPRPTNNAHTGQKPTIQKNDTHPTGAESAGIKENTDGVSTYEPQTESDQIRAIASALGEEGEKQLVQILVEQRQWKGLLPDPATFNQYPEEIRTEIINWNNVSIVDASAREDKLVNDFIAHRTRAQYFSFFLNLVMVVLSAVAFILTNNPACFSILSVPVLTIAVNVWQENKRDKDE